MNRHTSFYPIGFVILLSSFLPIAFFTLSAISLTSADRENKASASYSTASRAYSAACSKAEEQAASLAYSPDTPDTITVPIDKDHSLEAAISYHPASSHYTITSYTVILTKDWQADTTLPLPHHN
jgi:hypothetical protein